MYLSKIAVVFFVVSVGCLWVAHFMNKIEKCNVYVTQKEILVKGNNCNYIIKLN